MKTLITFAFFLIVACTNQKSNYQKKIKLDVDALVKNIYIDTSNNRREKVLLQIISQNNLDTLTLAQLQLALFQNTKNNINFQVQTLKNIITLEPYLSKHIQGKEVLAKAYYFLSNDLAGLHNYSEIKHYCEKYILFASAEIDRLYKVKVFDNLGNVYLRFGDEKKCNATFQEALNYCKSTKSIIGKHALLLSMANLYATTNELKLANSCVSEALSIPNLNQTEIDYLRMVNVDYMSSESQKLSATIQLLKEVKTEFVRFYLWQILADAYYETNKSKSIQFYLRAALTPNQEPRMIAKCYLNIADLYVYLNRSDSAAYFLDVGLKLVAATYFKNGNLLPVFEKLTSENKIFDIALAKANIYINPPFNEYKLNIAVENLLCAKKVAELIRQEQLFDESKFEWGSDLKIVSEKLLQCYYLLYTQTKNPIFAQKAFMIIEENKATALQDYTEQNILAQGQSDSNYAKYITLRQQLNKLEVQLQTTASNTEKAKLHKAINENALQLGIYKSFSKAAIVNQDALNNVEQYRHYLSQNHFNAISYFIGDEHIYINFYDEQKNTFQYIQCDTTIKDSVQVLINLQSQENIYNTQKERYLTLSNYIFKNLIGNIVQSNIKTTLLVLSEGVFNNLSFDALITDEHQTNSFLIKQFKTSYAYSIRSLMAQQMRDFNNKKSVTITAPFSKSTCRNLPLLHNSNIETKGIAKQMSHQIFSDTNATFYNFIQAIPNSQMLHIASHASAAATPKLEFYDSSIYINSIYNITMNQSLAYLNTCQSGSGKNYFSEGNLSLARAFYSNGVHNIVFTLWNMNDASTANISTQFYKNLKHNSNSIDALHEAKLNYLATQPKDKQAPYYWASLQHLGDGSLEKKDWFVDWWIWVLGAGVLVGLLALIQKRKSKLF